MPPIYCPQITIRVRLYSCIAYGHEVSTDTHYSMEIDKVEPAPGLATILLTARGGRQFITDKIFVIYENREHR